MFQILIENHVFNEGDGEHVETVKNDVIVKKITMGQKLVY